jgi:hypothetical protein
MCVLIGMKRKKCNCNVLFLPRMYETVHVLSILKSFILNPSTTSLYSQRNIVYTIIEKLSFYLNDNFKLKIANRYLHTPNEIESY